MAQSHTQILRWTGLRGYSGRSYVLELPQDIATIADDIELYPGTLGRRRPSTSALTLTSGPSAEVHYARTYRPSGTAVHYWAFSADAPLVIHSYSTASGTWTSRAITDAATGTGHPDAVTFNNKFFIAYDSSVNRLHVYDPVLNVIRKVGLDKPAAPTVANTGAGAYPATARYYRIQFLIKDGSDVQVMSELSDAVSFTPSGGGTAARITKSTTVDSATHWRIYGLIGSEGDVYDLYEQVGADTVVGTTTLDDTTNPSSYDGDQPPELGINIPPPSWKFMVTDGNRLVGAGAWETTASATETVPKTSRVYFTRVLGSSDLGDDESIPFTETLRYWIDVGERDGDSIVGLSEPLDGIIYVFKNSHIYQLIPTGIDTVPYRAEIVSSALGATSIDAHPHRCLVTTDHAVYFDGRAGPHRLSPGEGIQFIGQDIQNETFQDGKILADACFDPTKQVLYFLRDHFGGADPAYVYVFDPSFAKQTPYGWQGGWTRWLATAFTRPCTITMFEEDGPTNRRYPFIAGSHSSAAKVERFKLTTTSDAGGTYTPIISSRPFTFDAGASHVSLTAPIVETIVENVTPTLAMVVDHGRETRSVTCPTFAAGGSETHRAVTVNGLEAADAQALQIKMTYATGQTGPVHSVILRTKIQEPL